MKRLLCLGILAIGLTACGNAQRGAVVVNQGNQNARGLVTHVTEASTEESATFNTCHYLNIYYNGTNSASQNTALEITGTQICPSTSHADTIKIKAGSLLPDAERICIIPVRNGTVAPATCLAVATEATAQLQLKQATSLYLVKEQHLASYTGFITADAQTGGYALSLPANLYVYGTGAIGRTQSNFGFPSTAH